MFAGAAAQLDQHLAFRVARGRVRPHGAAGSSRSARSSGTDGWTAKTTVNGRAASARSAIRLPVLAGLATEALLPLQKRQRAFHDGARLGADPRVDRAEPLRVVTGVGENDVGAVPQQQPVGELLVDHADVAGDEHGAALRASCQRRGRRPCSTAWTAPPTQASTTTS